jgi:hypothetical protein
VLAQRSPVFLVPKRLRNEHSYQSTNVHSLPPPKVAILYYRHGITTPLHAKIFQIEGISHISLHTECLARVHEPRETLFSLPRLCSATSQLKDPLTVPFNGSPARFLRFRPPLTDVDSMRVRPPLTDV